MKNRFLLFIGFVFVMASSSCSTYSDEEISAFEEEIQAFLAEQKLVFKRTDSGLFYRFDAPGAGRNILYTDSVIVTFTGKLLNGQLFESEQTPLAFAVKDVIEGWQEGLCMSKQGAEIELIVPPQLGYGDHELDKIPANSILRYSIKVLEIR